MKKVLMILIAVLLVVSGCGKKSDEITMDRAKEIALEHSGIKKEDAQFVRAERDREDGIFIYEVEFYTKEGAEYDYDINANTGEVLSYNTDAQYEKPSANKENSVEGKQTSAGNIEPLTETEVKQIALDRVPGSTESDIKAFKLEKDDGINVYEGKIIYNKAEYEFEINADTGEIISWEEESVFD